MRLVDSSSRWSAAVPVCSWTRHRDETVQPRDQGRAAECRIYAGATSPRRIALRGACPLRCRDIKSCCSSNASSSDRKEIETARYPEIRFHSEDVTGSVIAPGSYRLQIGGPLSLHGVTQPYRLEAELQIFALAIRLLGESSLRMPDYRIPPVTAFTGTIRSQGGTRHSIRAHGTTGANMTPPRILVAGVGNISLDDDAFGCVVVQRLLAQGLPPEVRSSIPESVALI